MASLDEPKFTLTQLRHLIAAAEAGSMSQAARQLITSQSALSSSIAKLERSLNTGLLLRHHSRGLSLTAKGEEFIAEARAILARANSLSERIGIDDSELSGDFQLACYHTLTPFYMPPLVRRCGELYPNLRLRITEGEKHEVSESVLNGACELAITYDVEVPAEIDTTPLCSSDPYVLVARDHRLASENEVALTDLDGEDLVLLDIPIPGRYFVEMIDSAGIRVSVSYRSSNMETVRSAVANGLGVAILNQIPLTPFTYTGQRVVAVPLRSGAPAVRVVLARHRQAYLSRRARAVRELCESVVTEVRENQRELFNVK